MRVRRVRRLLFIALSALGGVMILTAPAGAAGPQRGMEGSPVPAGCPVTPYSAAGLSDDYTGTRYGQHHLWAGLDRAYRGVWYAGPQGLKVQWRVPNPKQLTVTGRRLDGSAPPLQVWFPGGYAIGFQPSGLVFPTAGCWQITATIPGETLRFTVFVHPAAEFPVAEFSAGHPAPTIPATLRRPLSFPPLGAGRACPRSPERQAARVAGAVLGDGPVYLQGLGTNEVVYLGDSSGTIAERWLVAPSYLGSLLIRGRQIGGSAVVQFGQMQELTWPAATYLRTPDWRVMWSFPIQVPGPGCYAFQIDGLHFTEVIVLEAVSGLPPGYAATPQP